MTYILELSPEVERALERTARRHGVAPDEYLREVVTREVQRDEGTADTATTDAATTDAATTDAAMAERTVREERRARRLAALAAVVETGREAASTPGALQAPLSDFALSRAGAYDAE